MRTLLALLLAFAGCSGSAPAVHDGPGPDGPAPGTFGATCTVVSNMSTECQSGVCTDSINTLPHPVCSQTCTIGNDSTCPVGSMGQKCNGKGYCRP
jgi:hypothetical protein